jgi:glycerol-3-phosphate dehydrogenase (NAD(P)+)
MRPEEAYEVGVAGAGAWGTTLARHLGRSGRRVILWAFEPEVVSEINTSRQNSAYLSGVDLPDTVRATGDLADFAEVDKLIIAVPSAFYADTIEALAPAISPSCKLLSATKGFTGPELRRPTELLEEVFPEHAIGALSGPNLSREVASGLPAISLVASKNETLVREFQSMLSTERFRVYGGADVIGTELGGALKNIMAIAAGIADGLELGENAMAALIVRGLAEMIKLSKILGANERTIYGVSGLGDLVCTCQSVLSRNHLVGSRLAQGERLGEILAGMSAVPEGPNTTKHVHDYSESRGIDLPITGAVYNVLFNEAAPDEALRDLMTRSLKME